MKFLRVTFEILLAVGCLVAAHGWDHQEHGHQRHPKYEFKYGVRDLQTGDIKDQWEERDGDQVKGSYSLREADGTTRVVDYYADAHSGFHAIVRKIGLARHPVAYHSHNDQHGGHGRRAHHGHGLATSYINVNHYH